MGFRQSYRCEGCELQAMVSGGKDCGFYVETETRYCTHCQILDDVGVRLWCKEMLPDLLPPSRVEELVEAEAGFGLCPTCKKPISQTWAANSPCPRCGGTVEAIEGQFEQWI